MSSPAAVGPRAWPLVLFAALSLLPVWFGEFQTVQINLWLISGLLALSLDLVWGFAGIFSFGQAAFFGLAGYVYGASSINLIGLTHETVTAILAGVIVAGAAAASLGYFMFYGGVGSVYVAVITLAVTLILLTFMGSTAGTQYAVGKALLGGYNGMTNIPSLTVGTPWGPEIALSITQTYLAVVIVAALVYLGVVLLLRRPFGRIITAIRENELRTELLGYDTRAYKLTVFALGGAIAGLAGTFYAAWGNFINPAVFSLQQSAVIVIWVLVGGRGTLLGPFLGAALVQYLSGVLGAISAGEPWEVLGNTFTPPVWMATFFQAPLAVGLLLIIIVLLFPSGLIPALAFRLRRRPSASEDRESTEGVLQAGAGLPATPEAGSEVVVETQEVVKAFGGLRAVNRVSLSLTAGELRCLIGPNGAGKSTFFNLLCGRYSPTAGRIYYRGDEITSLLPHQRARRGISIKLQIPSIYDHFTVQENLWLAAYARERDPTATERRVAEVLEEIGLPRRAFVAAGQLSHGEKQWLEIGMVVAMRPTMILLDEPTAGMTRDEVEATVALVRRLGSQATVVVVEHDMSFVRALNARVTVFHQGRIFAEGSVEELRHNEAVMDIYLGRHQLSSPLKA
ncbi:MAG TPA: ATP-binding cassette domain-containing protein [Anaerolineales bacterium]